MSTVKAHYQVIVVGLGAMGSAALYQLAIRGISVLGIDQFDPPHTFGSSHGETRVTRLANGEGGAYTELAIRARTLWKMLEAISNQSLLIENDVLIFGDPTKSSSLFEKACFLNDTMALACQYKIEHAQLTASQLRQRYPQFHLTGNEIGYLEPTGGYLLPEIAIRLQNQLAVEAGAHKRVNSPILAIDWHARPMQVKTANCTFTSDKIVLTAGAWVTQMQVLPPRTLKIYRQIGVWFKLKKNTTAFYPDQFPTFKWKLFEGNITGLYGFPIIDRENPTIKIGLEEYHAPIEVQDHHPMVSKAMVDDFYARVVQDRLPWVSGDYTKACACIYTVTKDWGFLIDTHSDNENLLVVSACSGHGFKHSPAIGELIAQIIADEPLTIDRTPFSFKRLQD